MIGILLRITLICGAVLLAATFAQSTYVSLFPRFEADRGVPAISSAEWSTSALPDRISPAVDAFDETLRRPVFFRGHVYPPAAPTVAPPQANAEPQALVVSPASSADGLKLKGVQWTQSGWRALIDIEGQSAKWLEVGQEVQGWQVGAIDAESVALTSPQGEAKLQLYSNKSVN